MIHSQSTQKISGYQKESETYFEGRLHGIAGGVGKEKDIAQRKEDILLFWELLNDVRTYFEHELTIQGDEPFRN